MAGWQSGYAAACKAVYAGSIPASASRLIIIKTYYVITSKIIVLFARVVELVDTRDLKSLASNSVPVQVRLRVPLG